MSLKRRRKNRDRGGHFNYLDEEVTARFSDKMLQARALHAQSHTREILDDDHDNDPSNDGNPTAVRVNINVAKVLKAIAWLNPLSTI
ncbi:hypothetical protein BGW38_004927 [Lunasporangiospora selenospora]|uniref:Uncharacterized protein n=1 Tax=Lunasporangiospora selenospora TaxID=979761 RepID=A0A9P6FNM3_9FUNG|nr:hypothetical protein BGW38_004927 [Lunasporangiospora selenospora]